MSSVIERWLCICCYPGPQLLNKTTVLLLCDAYTETCQVAVYCNSLSGLQGSSSSLSELSRASSGHPLNIPESPRSRFLSPGHFAHPIPASSRSALPCPSGLASPGNNGRPVVSLPQSFRQMSSVPQHAMLSSEPSSSLQGQGSSLQQPALLHLGHEHGRFPSKALIWFGILRHTSACKDNSPIVPSRLFLQRSCISGSIANLCNMRCSSSCALNPCMHTCTCTCTCARCAHAHTDRLPIGVQAPLVAKAAVGCKPFPTQAQQHLGTPSNHIQSQNKHLRD